MTDHAPVPIDVSAWTDSPLQFEEAIVLHTNIERAFELLTDFERLPRWMPFIRRVDVETTEQVGSAPGGCDSPTITRVIYPIIGPPTRERIVVIEPPNWLAYSASDETLHGMYTGHLGVVSCEATDVDRVRVVWRTYAQRGPTILIRSVGPIIVRWFVKRSLKNLRRLVERPM